MKKGSSKTTPQNQIDIEKVPFKALWKPAPSLKPSVSTMNAYLLGDLEAKAIIESWRFAGSRATRIVHLTRAEYDALLERQDGVVFNG